MHYTIYKNMWSHITLSIILNCIYLVFFKDENKIQIESLILLWDSWVDIK
jgi:hypothetical protein